MALNQRVAAAVMVMGLGFMQEQETFKVRLSPVPLDLAMRATITGKGSATAVLAGKKLTINGSFEGLSSPATVVRLHQGPVTAVRGPAIGDLIVSKSTSGTITGSLHLTPEQVENLRKGRMYIQIHSEKAPEGNLWGWVLK